jgi:hypothetical protein
MEIIPQVERRLAHTEVVGVAADRCGGCGCLQPHPRSGIARCAGVWWSGAFAEHGNAVAGEVVECGLASGHC